MSREGEQHSGHATFCSLLETHWERGRQFSDSERGTAPRPPFCPTSDAQRLLVASYQAGGEVGDVPGPTWVCLAVLGPFAALQGQRSRGKEGVGEAGSFRMDSPEATRAASVWLP